MDKQINNQKAEAKHLGKRRKFRTFERGQLVVVIGRENLLFEVLGHWPLSENGEPIQYTLQETAGRGIDSVPAELLRIASPQEIKGGMKPMAEYAPSTPPSTAQQREKIERDRWYAVLAERVDTSSVPKQSIRNDVENETKDTVDLVTRKWSIELHERFFPEGIFDPHQQESSSDVVCYAQSQPTTGREYLQVRVDLGRFGDTLSREDAALIEKYGAWYRALATGAIEAETDEQRHFLKAHQGNVEPHTQHETAWMRCKRAAETLVQQLALSYDFRHLTYCDIGSLREQLTPEDADLIQTYRGWYRRLTQNSIEAETDTQRHFVQAHQGSVEPLTRHEIAWMRYRKAVKQLMESKRPREPDPEHRS